MTALIRWEQRGTLSHDGFRGKALRLFRITRDQMQHDPYGKAVVLRTSLPRVSPYVGSFLTVEEAKQEAERLLRAFLAEAELDPA